MAQFNFYCVANDYRTVIEVICNETNFVVLPCWYPSRNIPSFRCYCEELEQALRTNKLLYIAGRFTREGVFVEQTAEGNYGVVNKGLKGSVNSIVVFDPLRTVRLRSGT